eukprot:CAMPEP_0182465898 /NCGR_PEP_ID=MMETSP1319-20130603/10939_1 /TAXON_ID=172717 /ORGANISM="Bolidomonas pacifica, Strain RCC208" /LENGTH=250 /DNA_ID=CAMNT_0024665787 /DNA_START=257 /DNA_END=1005 /DNA_ORIENTATION=-
MAGLAKESRTPAFLALVVLGFSFAASHLRWSALVTILQKRVAEGMRSKSKGNKRWTNLGLWQTDAADEDYNAACESLARKLAEAAKLGEGDAVLASGCGRGDELTLYKDEFCVQSVLGVDPDPDAAATFSPKRKDVELLCKTASEAAATCGHEKFTKVVALDNVYHYPSKESFFADAYHLLAGGGRLAVTDILSRTEKKAPLWIVMMLRFMGIPPPNLWSEDDYERGLAAAGFVNIKLERVGDRVLKRWL